MTAFDSDELLKRFLDRTLGAEEDVPVARLADVAIPAGVKAYLRAHLRERLSEELGRAPSFNRVRALSPSAARLQHMFIEQAAEAYVYPHAEFRADLENAVHFTENYVCRPRWTLSSFLFHTRDVIPVAELFAKLEFVSDYVYLPQLLRKTLSTRGQQEIDRAACTDLIRRIDVAVTKEHAPRELAALARPLFDFFSAGEDIAPQEIPLRPVLLFFEDKEMVGVKEYITGIYHFRNKNTISLEDLASLCDDFLGTRKDDIPSNEIDPGPVAAPVEAAQVEPEPLAPDAVGGVEAIGNGDEHAQAGDVPESAAEAAFAEPIVADLPTENLTEPLAPSAGVHEPDLPTWRVPPTEHSDQSTATGGPGDAAPELSIGAPFDEMESFLGDAAPDGALAADSEPDVQLELPLPAPPPVRFADLTAVITPEQRRRFVAMLCDRDADFYDLMISRLNEMRSWQDAKGYVRELFEINAIDPFQDEAIEFTDIIQQRFEIGTGPTA